MMTSRSFRLHRGSRAAVLLILAVATACADGLLDPDSTPGRAVASVEITPDTVHLLVGGTRALNAVPRAQDGRSLPGKAVEWKSSDTAIVRVDGSGNVTALSEGMVTITATSERTTGQARIQVTTPLPAAIATVSISGSGAEMEPGEVRQLTATLRAADGTVLSGREIAWASSDTSVIRVRADGSAVGRRGGTVTITATSEGKTGQTTLRIPEWLEFNLQSLGGQALPAVIATSRDTTERTESSTVIQERRVRLVSGQIWLSTQDWRYRQSYELQTWERRVVISNGNVTYFEEELVGARWISDRGEAKEFTWAGEPIYRSAVLPGHAFGVNRPLEGGRSIQQPIPGEGTEAYSLLYTR